MDRRGLPTQTSSNIINFVTKSKLTFMVTFLYFMSYIWKGTVKKRNDVTRTNELQKHAISFNANLKVRV